MYHTNNTARFRCRYQNDASRQIGNPGSTRGSAKECCTDRPGYGRYKFQAGGDSFGCPAARREARDIPIFGKLTERIRSDHPFSAELVFPCFRSPVAIAMNGEPRMLLGKTDQSLLVQDRRISRTPDHDRFFRKIREIILKQSFHRLRPFMLGCARGVPGLSGACASRRGIFRRSASRNPPRCRFGSRPCRGSSAAAVW